MDDQSAIPDLEMLDAKASLVDGGWLSEYTFATLNVEPPIDDKEIRAGRLAMATLFGLVGPRELSVNTCRYLVRTIDRVVATPLDYAKAGPRPNPVVDRKPASTGLGILAYLWPALDGDGRQNVAFGLRGRRIPELDVVLAAPSLTPERIRASFPPQDPNVFGLAALARGVRVRAAGRSPVRDQARLFAQKHVLGSRETVFDPNPGSIGYCFQVRAILRRPAADGTEPPWAPRLARLAANADAFWGEVRELIRRPKDSSVPTAT
jgi:hypothetical protein